MLTYKAAPTKVSVNGGRRMTVCKANPNPLQTELNKFLEKRRAVDRERLDTLKEIAESLKTIARKEVKSALELTSIVLPVNQIKKQCKKDSEAEDKVDDSTSEE